MIGILLAVIVAILWAFGEISYSSMSKKYDRTNIYMYTFLVRAFFYLGVVLIFHRSLFGTLDFEVMSSMLPIIFCDLFASLIINVAVYNGKLSVVSPIMAAYPILDISLGNLFLKENVSLAENILVLLICLSIVVLATNQKSDAKAPHPVKGIIFSIMYMFLVAFSTYFEKSIYNHSYTVYDLYYYKGAIYAMATIFFAGVILITPTKMRRPNWSILKGCGLTPIGNVLYSFALSIGNMTLVAPISSLYSCGTTFLSRLFLKEKLHRIERVCIYTILACTFLLILLKL